MFAESQVDEAFELANRAFPPGRIFVEGDPNELRVSSTGLVCPVGLSSLEACTAMRASLARCPMWTMSVRQLSVPPSQPSTLICQALRRRVVTNAPLLQLTRSYKHAVCESLVRTGVSKPKNKSDGVVCDAYRAAMHLALECLLVAVKQAAHAPR